MTDFLLFADYEELGPLAGAVILGIYAFTVMVALVFKAFRSRIALSIGFFASIVASLPAILAYFEVSQWPNVLKRESIVDLLRVTIVLLIFVWCTPFIQYFTVRSRAKRRNQQGT